MNPTLQAYAELQEAYDHYNEALFDGALPFCLITMQREKRTYGYFSPERFVHRKDKSKTDEIAMNPSYFGVIPPLEIMQTLVHEMAHLWQFHFGKPGRRGYHNKEWADKMESIGLMPSSTGRPGGKRTGEKMADYAIKGGLFLQATAELDERGFFISWLDRFPPATSPVAMLLSQGSAGPSAQSFAEVDTDYSDEFDPVGADAFDSDDDDSDREAALAELAETLGDVLQPKEADKSNRVKFTCPECGANAWGKPKLKLLCGEGDCNAARMMPVKAGEEDV